MSEENVELVRRGYAALSGGDMQTVLDLLHPRARIRSSAESPDGGVAVGREGLLANFARMDEVFDGLCYDVEEMVDAGERVVALVRMRARGKTSGLEIDDPIAHVWTMRDGMGVALDIYRDRKAALAAVSMGGPGGNADDPPTAVPTDP